MEIDLPSLLKATKLFSSLDQNGIKKLLSKLKQIKIKKGKFLFCQGELSDGVYLVAYGKLLVQLKTQYNEKKVLSEIHAGETVGEIGALSHEPRSASVKALEDTIVFQLSRDDFIAMCQHYPSMLIQIMEILSTRSRSLIQLLSSSEPTKKHIAIFPANNKTDLSQLSASLLKIIKQFPNVTIVSEYDVALMKKHSTKVQWREHLAGLQKKHEKIIYILNIKKSYLSELVLENIDAIYVAGMGHTKPYINPKIHKMIREEELTYKAKPELILLYPKDDQRLPTNTMHWLKLYDFGFHQHVRLYSEENLQRLMRFITGQAVAVVLGGGGARSWTHVGALKALRESGIPIDLICGTSGGAIVAGYYALNETEEDSRQCLSELSQITYKAVSLRNLTWPAVSLFSGDKFTQKQQQIFGNHRIEDLWLPFFCVSCNLSKSSAVVHSKGRLWKKIRASTSVPGVFPPVVINGQLHMDGGIVNNLPVDIVKKISTGVSVTIAVELIHVKQKDRDYNFPPVLPLRKAFMAKMGWGYKQYRFPSFVDTFLKSLLAGSSAKQNENAKAADVLISPMLSGFDLLRVPKGKEKSLIDIGYKATMDALQKPPKKSKHPRIKARVPTNIVREKYKTTKSKKKKRESRI